MSSFEILLPFATKACRRALLEREAEDDARVPAAPFDFGQTESKDEQNACILAALCLEACASMCKGNASHCSSTIILKACVSLITFHPNREAMQSTDYATHTTTGERKIRFTVILETEIDKSRLSTAWVSAPKLF